MIYLGHHITAVDDELQKVDLDKVWHAIMSPKPETAALIRQLRIVRNLNPKQYSVLKRSLPYLVCGTFNPARRKIENFAYTEHFILDIDHLTEKEMEIGQLRIEIQHDPHVVLCFASPSHDGLKVLFRLSERCFDAGIFSLFYKLFAQKFSQQHGIQQVIDLKTCDVTRACFVSMDPEAYYNPSADPVNLTEFVDTENQFDFFERTTVIRQQAEKELEDNPPQKKEIINVDVSDDVMANIKKILNLSTRKKNEKPPAYVPQQLEEVTEELTKYITKTGIEITEIQNIQYGKKIRTRVGCKMAETNVFYGRKGFSVVQSPRTGTNAELNQAVADLIMLFFNDL